MILDPPWRAVGGKRWLAPILAPEINALKPALYVEPFLGAGAVALQVRKDIPKLLGDVNHAFITAWKALQYGYGLYDELVRLKLAFAETAEGYIAARASLNSLLKARAPVPASYQATLGAHVMHILARSFNGIWRTNKSRQYNVPWGKLKNPRTYTEEELQAYQEALVGIVFEHSDFRMTLQEASPHQRVLIYADSPYHNTFDGYTADGFDEVDQRDLAEWLKYMALKRKHYVIATNSDTPLIREIYSWARVEEIEERHSVGSKGARRGKRKCLLIRAGAW